MKKLLLLIPLLFLGGCINMEYKDDNVNKISIKSISKAEQAAIDDGYTDLRLDGVPIIGCGRDDSLFTSKIIYAKNSNGKEVKLIVCCGLLFKGCSIRH